MIEEQDVDAVATFDWTTFDSPSTSVITAIAEEAGMDPVTLKPLGKVIDPDALDTLLASTNYSERPPDASLEFTYQNYRILVKANGRGYLYVQEAGQLSTTESKQFDVPKQIE